MRFFSLIMTCLVTLTGIAKSQESIIYFRDIEISQPRTPVFQTSDGEDSVQVIGMPLYQRGDKEWLRVSAQYETRQEWIDELTITIYVLLPAKGGKKLLFSGKQTFRDIPEGREHLCDMYLHFNTLKRYFRRGTIDYAVIAHVDGQEKTVANSDEQRGRWWENMTLSGPLMTRLETPFCFLNEEQYQATTKP